MAEKVENKIQRVFTIYSKIGNENDLLRVAVPVDPNLKGKKRDIEIGKKILNDIIGWREDE